MAKSLSENSCGPQGEDSELKMQEPQIVGDFLFPAYQQASGAIGPGMRPFNDPASGLAIAMLSRRGVVVLFGNVRDVTPSASSLANRFGIVPLVRTKMLLLPRRRLRAAERNAGQSLLHQGLIMRIGAIHRCADRHASTVGQHRSLHPQLAAIGRVFGVCSMITEGFSVLRGRRAGWRLFVAADQRGRHATCPARFGG